jgi:hypothetical protein
VASGGLGVGTYATMSFLQPAVREKNGWDE